VRPSANQLLPSRTHYGTGVAPSRAVRNARSVCAANGTCAHGRSAGAAARGDGLAPRCDGTVAKHHETSNAHASRSDASRLLGVLIDLEGNLVIARSSHSPSMSVMEGGSLRRVALAWSRRKCRSSLAPWREHGIILTLALWGARLLRFGGSRQRCAALAEQSRAQGGARNCEAPSLDLRHLSLCGDCMPLLTHALPRRPMLLRFLLNSAMDILPEPS